MSVSACAFADDLTIFAGSENNLEAWEVALQKRGLNINAEKTKVMTIGRENRRMQMVLGGRDLEQTESFKYLGVRIHMSGTNEA